MKRKGLVFYLLSFIIPVCIFLVLTLITKFNISNQVGFYKDLLILTINSFKFDNYFYTFTYGLGTDLYNLKTLYMNSIFNILFMFFKNSDVNIFVTLSTYIKIGLMGLSMSYYLNSIDDDKYSIRTIVFSLMYVLSSFVISYFTHIMILDTLILLPLIILGVDKMIINKRSRFYIFFMSLSIISNFYTGYMVCVFTLLYFIYKSVITYNFNIKGLVKFIFSSLLCGFISSIVLLPQYYSLGLNETNSLSSLIKISPYFYNMTIGSDSFGPHIYSSMITIVLCILYFFNSRFNKLDKIYTLLFFIIFYVTFSFGFLDYIWNLFKLPVLINHEYVFIYIFFVVLISYKCFINREGISINKYVYLSILLFILLAIICFIFINYSLLKLILFIISLIMIIVYLILINNKCYNTILVLIIIELVINGFVILFNNRSIDNNCYKYLDEINYIKSIDNGFYRINSVDNSSVYYSYNGISDSKYSDSILGVKYYVGVDSTNYIISDNIYINNCLDIIFGIDSSAINDLDDIDYINSISDHFSNVKYNSIGYVFKGHINVSEDEMVFSTIPYYPGYQIYVDDDLVDYYKVYDAFVGFDITSGEHNVYIKYIPKGYKNGTIITILSIVIALGYSRWEYYCIKVNKEIKRKQVKK